MSADTRLQENSESARHRVQRFIKVNALLLTECSSDPADCSPMQIKAIDSVEIPADATRLPLTITQSSAILPAFALVLVSGVSIAGLLLPVTLIAAHSFADPRSAAAILDRPMSSTMLLAGLVIALGLLTIPFRAGLKRLRQRCAVQLAGDHVAVRQQGLIVLRSWSAPYSHFAGVTHHIRATLSGARHEIILVHPDHRKHVLLNLGSRTPEIGADQFARLLGMQVLPASVLYDRRTEPSQVASTPITLPHNVVRA